MSSLRSIGRGKTWKEQDEVCKTIKQQASKERKTDLQEGIGTEEDFKNLYGWFIDAMLQKLSNCSKQEGTSRELKRFSIIRDKLRSHRQGLQELNRIQQSTAVLGIPSTVY